MKEKPVNGKVIYVYDALCGWCYGFSPVISELHKKFGYDLEFEVVSGGMVTGERVGPISDMAAYISGAYHEVERASSEIKFGKQFLEITLYRDDIIFSSLEPAIALSALKTLQPENAVPFASAIQKAIYYDGAAPADHETYVSLAVKFGIVPESFRNLMKDQSVLSLAQLDFKRSRDLGVTGFPTTFFEDADGNLTILSRGFTNYENLSSRLEQALRQY